MGALCHEPNKYAINYDVNNYICDVWMFLSVPITVVLRRWADRTTSRSGLAGHSCSGVDCSFLICCQFDIDVDDVMSTIKPALQGKVSSPYFARDLYSAIFRAAVKPTRTTEVDSSRYTMLTRWADARFALFGQELFQPVWKVVTLLLDPAQTSPGQNCSIWFVRSSLNWSWYTKVGYMYP